MMRGYILVAQDPVKRGCIPVKRECISVKRGCIPVKRGCIYLFYAIILINYDIKMYTSCEESENLLRPQLSSFLRVRDLVLRHALENFLFKEKYIKTSRTRSI